MARATDSFREHRSRVREAAPIYARSKRPSPQAIPQKEGSMRRLRMLLAAGMTTVALMAASPATAQPQSGLVNVDISGVTIQVPVAIAANICDVNVAVLVNDLKDDAAQCDATADADAITVGGGGGGGGPQEGLVNVRISDVTVQVPLAVAANICDVNVAVLVDLIDDAAASCDADASSVAEDRP
jgi:hypothetical protein